MNKTLSQKAERLIAALTQAAQMYGWAKDQGSTQQSDDTQLAEQKAFEALSRYVRALETRGEAAQTPTPEPALVPLPDLSEHITWMKDHLEWLQAMAAGMKAAQPKPAAFLIGQRVQIGGEIGTVTAENGKSMVWGGIPGVWVRLPSRGYSSCYDARGVKPLPNGQL